MMKVKLMKRFIFAISAVLLLLSVPAAAADTFWKTKTPDSWTDQEMDRLLQKSPWAKEATVNANQQDMSAVSAESGYPGGGLGGPGGRSAGRAESDHHLTDMVIRWLSAEPVRLALKRTKKSEVEVTAEKMEKYFIVAAVSRSLHSSREDAKNLKDVLLQNTFLLRKTGPPIVPEKMEALTGREEQIFLFFFPRTNPILSSDKEIEFISNPGNLSIHAKFSLKEMVYQGKLEL